MVSVLLGFAMLGQDSTPNLSGAFDLDGQAVTVDCAASKATVLVFMSPVCPIANRYAPEIARIYAEYKPKGVAMFRVYPDSLDSVPDYRKHAEEFKLKMPALVDPDHKLVKATGVRVTPEVAVFSNNGERVYRGRIDDSNIEHGKIRENYRRDLRIALDEVLAGKKVSVAETAAIGCYIPDSD